MTYSPTKKVQNIIPATQETVGPFFQDSPSVDYVFQLPAAYFIQQKDSPFNYFFSPSNFNKMNMRMNL